MPTAAELIDLSLTASGVLGVGQTALAQDSNRALLILNMMLEQWQLAPFATLTTAGAFPNEYYEPIMWGLAKRLRPIYQLPSDEKLDKLAADALTLIRNGVAAPAPGPAQAQTIIALAFRAAGVIGVAQTPLPRDLADGLNILNMMLEQWQLATLAALTTIVTFPAEYQEAILWGLAKRIRPIYQLPPDPEIEKLAENSLALIRNSVAASAPGATTAQDLISTAFRAAGIVGVAQTPLPRDLADGLNWLNMMLSQWQRRRWLIWHLVDRALPMTGKKFYTIGTGANFDVMRPDRIEAAFIRFNPTPGEGGGSDFGSDFGPDFGGTPDLGDGLPVDYGLTLLESREDYNRIALKNLRSFPQFLFYDSAMPWGNLFPWPIPNSQYELHLSLKETLNRFPTLTTPFILPPEYAEAIWTNLTIRIASLYPGVSRVDPSIAGLARASLATIRGANAQVPILQMPRALVRGGGYNIFGDTFGPSS